MDHIIGFIGGGNMSSAIGLGIINKGAVEPSKMWVSGPHIENLSAWTKYGVNTTTKNGEVLKKCDIIFLGVKPHMLNQAIDDCVTSSSVELPCSDSKLFVSMLAGISLDTLSDKISLLVKIPRVIRIMPNTPMMVGAGCCLLTSAKTVSKDSTEFVYKLLSNLALIEVVQEPMIDSLGTLTGCGPAYVFVIIEALSDAAVKQGVPRQTAIKLAAQMLLGSAKMVLDSKKHPAVLKDEVCSPGGSTICGIAALEEGKIRSTLIQAVEASYKKNKELGKK